MTTGRTTPRPSLTTMQQASSIADRHTSCGKCHRGSTINLSLLFRFSDPGADKELRASECRGADVVLVCFPVTELKQDVPALANELRVFKDGAKMDSVVLVGTKIDLKDGKAITAKKGWNLARELGAKIYLECSSTNRDSVRELFKEVIDISTSTTKKHLFLSELRNGR